MNKHPIPRTHYDRTRVAIDCSGPGRTKQSFKEECNINNIMAKFQRTGLIDHVAKWSPTYGDQLTPDDYQNAQMQIAQANTMYEELPSSLRRKFPGPAAFLEFVTDPTNEEKMREMKLLPGKKPELAQKPTTPPASKDASTQEKSAKTETSATKGATEAK